MPRQGPLLRGVWDSSSCAMCVCPGGQGEHSQRTHLSLICWCIAVRGGSCHLLLAFFVNQDIGTSSTATVTILPGVINQGEESTHPCPPTLPTPPARASTPVAVWGPARVQPAVFQLPSLALCHNNNLERVALEGDRAPQGRGGQKNVGAASL